jgi:hypothetical protein
MVDLDRSHIAKCLAKAIAFAQVDKPDQAEDWARELIKELRLANILKETS